MKSDFINTSLKCYLRSSFVPPRSTRNQPRHFWETASCTQRETRKISECRPSLNALTRPGSLQGFLPNLLVYQLLISDVKPQCDSISMLPSKMMQHSCPRLMLLPLWSHFQTLEIVVGRRISSSSSASSALATAAVPHDMAKESTGGIGILP